MNKFKSGALLKAYWEWLDGSKGVNTTDRPLFVNEADRKESADLFDKSHDLVMEFGIHFSRGAAIKKE